MKVTFAVHSRMLGYNRGQIIEIDYADMPEPLKAVLRLGRHMTLIDPLELPDDSEKGPNNSKEYRPFGVTDNGQPSAPSSRKREIGTSEHSSE